MPCVCNDVEIRCGGNENIDLSNIFGKLSKLSAKSGKHFKFFYLNNTFITELKENTFSDITFGEITINDCSSLRSIHKNAFNTTDQVTTEIRIESNPKLSSPDNSIFDALSRFVHAHFVLLADNNVSEIPSNAFHNEQDQLKVLLLIGKSIKKLGNNAFSLLKGLTSLTLESTSIDFIPENAFEFNEVSNESLTIERTHNKHLNITGFSMHSLTKLKRPTYISIDIPNNSSFQYLDQKIFEPFLLSNDNNAIQIWTGSIDCNDCRNYWMKKNPTLLKRLIKINCSNHNPLNDTVNFKGCNI